MTRVNSQCGPVISRLSYVGMQYLTSDLGITGDCFTHLDLARAARLPLAEADLHIKSHLDTCPRCAHTYSAFRAAHIASSMPDAWAIVLRFPNAATPTIADEDPLYFRIRLEDRAVEFCASEAEWTRSSLCIRGVLLIDTICDVVSLSIRDVPTPIRAITLKTPRTQQTMVRHEQDDCFRVVSSLTGIAQCADTKAAAK